MSRKGFEARMSGRLAALLAGCAALVVMLSGCGKPQTVTGTNAEIEIPGETIKLDEGEYFFKPAAGKAKAGLISIVASNVGKEYHALRVVVPAKDQPKGGSAQEEVSAEEIGEIVPGATERLNLKLKPGTYAWYCPLSNHRRLGMRGKLTIQ